MSIDNRPKPKNEKFFIVEKRIYEKDGYDTRLVETQERTFTKNLWEGYGRMTIVNGKRQPMYRGLKDTKYPLMDFKLIGYIEDGKRKMLSDKAVPTEKVEQPIENNMSP